MHSKKTLVTFGASIRHVFGGMALLTLAGCSSPNPGKDSNLQKQTPNVEQYKEVFMRNAASYPIVRPEDRQNIQLVTTFFNIVTDSVTAGKIMKKFTGLAGEDTSDWQIGDLLTRQEFFDFLVENKIYVNRYLDWKDPSTELAYIISDLTKKSHSQNRLFNLTNRFRDAPIDEAYPVFGKELSAWGLTLFDMDIDCDCYIPFVIKQKDTQQVRLLVNRFGFKYKDWTEEW
jgi:hypothetical protein